MVWEGWRREAPPYPDHEARRALAVGVAQCVTMIAEIELPIVHQAWESLDDLHRHGIGFFFGL